jgi:hypothetical protein
MTRVQVGKCRECGVVVNETIAFPNQPTCKCGRQLTKATVATKSEVQERV